MIPCPRCKSEKVVKNGSVRGIKKHMCKECGYQFTKAARTGKPLSIKLFAVVLYLHGVSMHAIGKWVGVSTPAVLKWIRNYAKDHYEKPIPGEVTIIELDELWHYLEKKPINSGYGRLIVEIQSASLTGNVGIVIKLP
jgi:transposase-like protein